MNWCSTAGKKRADQDADEKARLLQTQVGEGRECRVLLYGPHALRRGEIVELPIGWMQTARPPAKREKLKFQRFKNIQTDRNSQTKEIFSKWVTYPDKIIRFRADPKLIEKGPFPPPPPSPELRCKGEELERLLARLGFPDVTGLDLKSLLAASVDHNKFCADADLPGYLDRLLARLRELIREGRKFTGFGSPQRYRPPVILDSQVRRQRFLESAAIIRKRSFLDSGRRPRWTASGGGGNGAPPNRRYQQSERGRQCHRRRQCRYRKRQAPATRD